MKAAIIIPTLNAAESGKWHSALAAVDSQNFEAEKKIIIDSSSCGKTCSMAAPFGWECRKILKKNFNHGRTRDAIVRSLAEDGFDTVIFLSQDVILAEPDSLKILTDFLWHHPIAGCYGKQRSPHKRSLDAWQRIQCYPDKSAIKTLKDIPQSGLMTTFFSNAFSAWKTAEVIRYGGFPETNFGEDMLLTSSVLNRGGAVGYCAEATAIHEHFNALPWHLFARGIQIGSFHQRHPALQKQFGKISSLCSASVPITAVIPFGIKVAGYICGRIGGCLFPDGHKK